jgi:hypothetical protein
LKKENEEVVGKYDDFKRLSKTFILQIIILFLFCCGFYSYYIYKYISISSTISVSKDTFAEIINVVKKCHKTTTVVCDIKEVWVQGFPIYVPGTKIEDVQYYVTQTALTEGDLVKLKSKSLDVLGNMANVLTETLESEQICSYGIIEKTYCETFWNGILKGGLGQAIYKILYKIQLSYFKFKKALAEGTYTESMVRSVVMDKDLLTTEEFLFGILYPIFIKYIDDLSAQIKTYYDDAIVKDRVEYAAIVIVIFFVVSIIWIKLVYILNNGMWRCKAILIFLPLEFMRGIDKKTQTFIIATLK